MMSGGLRAPSDWGAAFPVVAAALGGAVSMRPRASDVHVRQGCRPWCRQGGTFMPVVGSERVGVGEMESVFAWVGERSRDDWRGGVDTTAVVVDATGTRWRATVYDGVAGLGATFRRMPRSVPSLHQLGLPNSVRMLASQTSGLVVVAGAARSGRTTTLAAMVGLINATRECHVVTIEHPVEYVHESNLSLISQRDVPPAGRGDVLAVVRHSDPDVVLVGDCVTAADFELCLTLAAAGHLVLTAAHAVDSVDVCERIVAVAGFTGQVLLSQVLRGVVTQRLVPDAQDARGCHAVAEVLLMSHSLRSLLKPGGDVNAVRAHMLNRQASTDYVLAAKCRQGGITEEAARGVSVDPEMFDSLLHQSLMV